MNHTLHNKHRQQGAVLVVSLIMLLIMTILGISTMGTAKMEMRMAANDLFLENAFQLADTGLDTTLAALRAETIAIVPGVPGACNVPGAVVAVPALNGTHQTTMCYVGDSLAFNGLTGLGFTMFNWQANTQGIAQSQASSLHALGLQKLGPPCGGC